MSEIKSYMPNLPKRSIRIGVSPWSGMHPNCLRNYLSNPHDYFCEPGFELELFSFIAVMLNLAVEFKYTSSPGCGYKLSNGTWTGLMGMLQKDEIDITGNLCLVDEVRSNETWLGYSWPVFQYKQAFLIKAPDMNTNSFHVRAPFHPSVWFTLIGILILFFLVILLVYYLFKRYTFTEAFLTTTCDIFNILFGLDCPMITHIWQCFMCFIGYVLVLYSTFVTTEVLKLVDIERPFQNHIDLAKSLYNGEYKLLDYYDNPFVRCYSEDVCKTLNDAHDRHRHYHSNSTKASILLETLATSQLKLVLVRSRGTLINYLDEFESRHRLKLWLIDDEASGEQWFSYLYRKTFDLSPMIRRALILMGDSKENVYDLYSTLSKQAIQSKRIVGKLSEKTRFSLKLTTGIWRCYLGGMAVSVASLITEVIIWKSKNLIQVKQGICVGEQSLLQ